jgi:L-2-hydroxyglutarate oxidase LhgO
MTEVDIAIVGGGVAGLAAAAEIALGGKSVCVLERHPRVGMETSTHNSGVIHAGIYHPAGSLKSTLCVRGRHLLYEFCAAHGVPHRRCGKLIVAADGRERSLLEPLLARGVANDVEGLVLVDGDFAVGREPQVRVDAEAYVRTLLRSGQESGVVFLPGTRLIGAAPHAGGVVLTTASESVLAGQVVNAAGLHADDVSALLGAEPFTIYPCRGEYAEFTPARR